MKLLAVILAAVLLGGCQAMGEAIADRHASACRAYGLTEGTDAFALCYQRESHRYWDRIRRDAGLED